MDVMSNTRFRLRTICRNFPGPSYRAEHDLLPFLFGAQGPPCGTRLLDEWVFLFWPILILVAVYFRALTMEPTSYISVSIIAILQECVLMAFQSFPHYAIPLDI